MKTKLNFKPLILGILFIACNGAGKKSESFSIPSSDYNLYLNYSLNDDNKLGSFISVDNNGNKVNIFLDSTASNITAIDIYSKNRLIERFHSIENKIVKYQRTESDYLILNYRSFYKPMINRQSIRRVQDLKDKIHELYSSNQDVPQLKEEEIEFLYSYYFE